MKTARAVPFSVLGGFLGAGKTTLLNRLLVDPDAPRCAVLVNDFGDIAVDASLVKSHGGETIALKNGCVCCAIGNDLGRGISTALDLETPPEHIVVETSGVAHPGRVAEVAHISPELTLGGVFVLADAAAVCAQLDDRWIADTVDQQLASAQTIVVSKLDEMPPENQAGVIEMLSERYPARSLATTAEVGWAQLLYPARGHRCAASPSANHARFVTRTIRSTATVDLHKLTNWLERNPDVYRMKGWAMDTEDGRVKLIQAVGRRVSITRCDANIEERLLALVIGNDNLPSSEDILRAIANPGGVAV